MRCIVLLWSSLQSMGGNGITWSKGEGAAGSGGGGNDGDGGGGTNTRFDNSQG